MVGETVLLSDDPSGNDEVTIRFTRCFVGVVMIVASRDPVVIDAVVLDAIEDRRRAGEILEFLVLRGAVASRRGQLVLLLLLLLLLRVQICCWYDDTLIARSACSSTSSSSESRDDCRTVLFVL